MTTLSRVARTKHSPLGEWGFAILAALLLLLASGPSASAQPAPETPTPTLPAKSLTIAVAQEPDGLFLPTRSAGRLAASLLFDPLVGLDDHMRPYPVLAAQIPSPDNDLVQLTGSGADRRLVITMPLRDGVTWSDGQPFTADDVVFTWQLMANQQSGFETPVEDKIKSVDKVDDLTVRFTYLSANEARALDPARYRDQGNAPVVDPLYFFGLYDAPAIYPSHVLRQLVGDDPRHSRDVSGLASSSFARNAIGTGPYTLVSWEPGSTLVFASRGLLLPQRFGRPAVDSVTLRVVPDKNASLTALQAGEVQVVAQDGLDAGDSPVLDSLPGVQALYTPGTALEQITFNLDGSNPALGDVNVRRAIAYAIDRQALNETALFGKAEVPASVVPSWSWAANSAVPTYPHDPAQAEEILERAGWTRLGDGIRQKNGQRLSFTLSSSPAPFRASLTDAIENQLARVGIGLKVDLQPSSVLFDTRPNTPQALVARTFDLAELAWIGTYDPGTDLAYTLHSASVPARANAYQGGNYGTYHSARADELLDQARSIDPGFRKAALGEAQTIWQTDLPALPLLVRPIVTAARQNLTNFRPTPAPGGETWNVEQWDLT